MAALSINGRAVAESVAQEPCEAWGDERASANDVDGVSSEVPLPWAASGTRDAVTWMSPTRDHAANTRRHQ